MANKKGKPNVKAGRNKDTTAASRGLSEKADNFALRMAPLLRQFTKMGFTRYRMAKELNALGEKTSYEKPWTPMAVGRVFKRLEALVARGVRLGP